MTQVVRKCVPKAKLTGHVQRELTYALPNEDSPRFPALFRTLEQQSRTLGTGTFGVVGTTMEEVFLR